MEGRVGRGGWVRLVSIHFGKVMSHYIQYKLLPCREQLTVYRQTDIITDRQSIVEDLRSLKITYIVILI